jgi:hypothetical protein
MAGLKFLRQVVGLVWIGVFLWAVVSLFRADWGGLIAAVVIWFVLGLIFSSIHTALQRSELEETQGLLSRIALAVELDDWNGALAHSNRLVATLRASANRDRTALGSNGQQMVGPFSMALVGHALLLGATGRLDEARRMLTDGFPAFEAFAGREPQLRYIIDLTRQLASYPAGRSDYIAAARQFHSFA